MDTTPRLQLPYIAPQQAQKQVSYNEAMRALDLLVQPAVKSASLGAPPASPAEGDSYIVAPTASGEWSGMEGRIASRIDGAWSFRLAAAGWQAYVEDTAEIVIQRAGAWESFVSNGGNDLAKLGINAGADLTNRLTVASDATLFTHDGAGHRLTLNKAAATDTGSVVFQTGWSGRAEFGLAGDDDFHVKVSPDGASWYEALTIARGSGLLRLPRGQLAFPATANPAADPNTLDDYREGSWMPGISFGGSAVGVGYGGGTAGRYTRVGRLCVASGQLQLTSKGTSSGAAVITGLPFASVAAAPGAACTIGTASGFSGIAGAVLGMVAAGSTEIDLGQANDGAAAPLTQANFTDGTLVQFSLAYDAA